MTIYFSILKYMRSCWSFFILITIFILSSECPAQNRKDSTDVLNAFNRYIHFVSRMESDSIATLFAQSGVLVKSQSELIIGPTAILEFLQTFRAYNVLSHRMESDSMFIKGDTGWQKGRYWQQVRIPSGDTIKVEGRFHIDWQRVKKDGWRIQRMSTSPAKL